MVSELMMTHGMPASRNASQPTGQAQRGKTEKETAALERPARSLDLPTRVLNALKSAYARRCAIERQTERGDRYGRNGTSARHEPLRSNGHPHTNGSRPSPQRRRQHEALRVLTPHSFADGTLTVAELARDVRRIDVTDLPRLGEKSRAALETALRAAGALSPHGPAT